MRPSNRLLAAPLGIANDNNNTAWIAGNEIAGVQPYGANCSQASFGAVP